MSDHRCHLKIEFSIYGMKFEWDTSINYAPNEGDGIDDRIVDWFNECYAEARAAWDHESMLEDERRAAEKLERDERQQLARLKAKYEPELTAIPLTANPLLPRVDVPASPGLGPNWTTAYDREDWGRMGDMDGTGVRQRNPTATYEGEPHSLTGPWGRVNVVDGSSVRWIDPTPVGDFSASGIVCRVCGCKVAMKAGDVVERGDPRLCEHLGGPKPTKYRGFGMKAGEVPNEITRFTVDEQPEVESYWPKGDLGDDPDGDLESTD